MKRRFVVAAIAALSLLALPVSGRAETVNNVSLCTHAFSGGQGGCGFDYVGVRVIAWAVAVPGTSAVTIEAQFPIYGGGYFVIARCTVSTAAPVCIGDTMVVPDFPNRQHLACVAHGTGRAQFGCLSEDPLL